jgi:peptidyl-Lys metalloendopeptidase
MSRALLSVLVAACFVGIFAQQVTLIPDNSDVGLTLAFVVTNNGDQPLNFITWNTPFEGIYGDEFDVISSSGRRAEYIGMLVKRAPQPDLSEFVTLLPGESKSTLVDLSLHYALTNDTWTVTLNTFLGIAQSPALLGNGAVPAVKFVPLRSESVSSDVNAVFPLPQQAPATKVGDYISCSAAQSNQVDDAVTLAFAIARNAFTYLKSPCVPEFTKWFGAAPGNSSRLLTTDHYTKIGDQIASAFFSVNCAPPACSSPSVFAYVYPTDASFTVYLCGQFWKASPSVAYDSQPGTLVHEFSHFRVLGGTQDYVYGTTGALNLAKTDPAKAVMNADNHEYFAESQPHC